MLALLRRTSFLPPSMVYISVIIIHITNYNRSRTFLVNVQPDSADLNKTSVMLKCTNGWQNSHSRKCVGAIANRMPMGTEM